MRRTAVACVAFWLVSALFLGIGAIAADPARSDDDEAEAAFVGRIGDERAAARRTGYVVAPDLVDVARRHAEEMRSQQRLHHNPRLGEDVQGWQAVGENVGVGPTVEEIHQKFMASPSHRDNILSARFTEVGVGVVVDGTDVWVVQVFRLPRSSAPAPAPAPAAATDEPAPGPEPRPTPAPSSAPANGSVRAANAAGGAPTATTPAVPPATSAPAPPTTSAASSTVTTATDQVPTSLVGATATTAAADPLAADKAAADARTSTPTSNEYFGSASQRQVTWPVALAATMLLGVVTALAAHVGGAKVRSVAAAGRRTSLLDVWELALAR